MSNVFQRITAMFTGNETGDGTRDTPRTAGSAVESYMVRGIEVHVRNTRPDIATADVLERLDEALGLIETHQSWRFRHLQRDINGISVERFACRGAFIPNANVIITELTFLARRDITAAPVASSIVHEGIHARVHAMGVDRNGSDIAHEERLCRRAELAFGQKLPTALGAPVIERALHSLALDDADVAPVVDWQEAQRRQDAIDAQA